MAENLELNYKVKWMVSNSIFTSEFCTITDRMLSVRTAEKEGYNLLTVLLERGLVSVDHDPWKLLTTALPQPARWVREKDNKAYHLITGLRRVQHVVWCVVASPYS